MVEKKNTNQTKLENFKYEIAQEMGLAKKSIENNKKNKTDNSKNNR